MLLDYYALQAVGGEDSIVDPDLNYMLSEALENKNSKPAKKGAKKRVFAADPWGAEHCDFCALPDDLALEPDINSAAVWVPLYGFVIELPFQLEKPFHSRDERIFYRCDNPLCREKVFKTPMFPASGWKGALRAAMTRQLAEWWSGLDEREKKERGNCKQFLSWRLQLARLFGNELGAGLEDTADDDYLDRLGGSHLARLYRRSVETFCSKSGFFAGHLNFFPTFFSEVCLEVINPHDRETGATRKGPIEIECVPKGAKGKLRLMYVPSQPDCEVRRKEAAKDLRLLAKGVKAVLMERGFGAKTSSGFGTASNRLPEAGTLLVKVPPAETVEREGKTESQSDLPRYLQSPDMLIEELRRPDGSLKEENEYIQWLEGRGQSYNASRRQMYEKAKKWWERRIGSAATGIEKKETAEEHRRDKKETPAIQKVRFNTLDEFLIKAAEAADCLTGEAATK